MNDSIYFKIVRIENELKELKNLLFNPQEIKSKEEWKSNRLRLMENAQIMAEHNVLIEENKFLKKLLKIKEEVRGRWMILELY